MGNTIEQLAGVIRDAWVEDGAFSPEDKERIRSAAPTKIQASLVLDSLPAVEAGHGVVVNPDPQLKYLFKLLNPEGKYSLSQARIQFLKGQVQRLDRMDAEDFASLEPDQQKRVLERSPNGIHTSLVSELRKRRANDRAELKVELEQVELALIYFVLGDEKFN